MAQIKIVLLDDSGSEITTRFYDLSNNLAQLNDMEREIESLRPNILGDITHDLLEQAQIAAEKKVGSRGYQSVKIKTINGIFGFRTRKYVLGGKSTNWLRLTQVELSCAYESRLVRDFGLEYAKFLSYEKVEDLVKQRMGNATLSDQHIFDLVTAHAARVQAQQISEINNCLSKNYDCKARTVNIYSADAEEIIFLSDGVCE